MEKLVELLKKSHYTLSSCESFTVGKFGASIGSVSGASYVYKGTLVTYQTEIKLNVLKVNQHLVDSFGVVSKEVATAMAVNGKALFDSDICVSFTGNAGPEAMEDKPVGLVYMAIAFNEEVETFEYRLIGSRISIQCQAVEIIKSLLIKKLVNKDL